MRVAPKEMKEAVTEPSGAVIVVLSKGYIPFLRVCVYQRARENAHIFAVLYSSCRQRQGGQKNAQDQHDDGDGGECALNFDCNPDAL